MTILPRRKPEYWSPMVLPILLGLVTVVSYGVAHHSRGADTLFDAHEVIPVTQDDKNRPENITVGPSIQMPRASYSIGNRERPASGREGRTGSATPLEALRQPRSEETEPITPNWKDHEEGVVMKKVLLEMLRRANDSILLGVLAAYFHFLTVMLTTKGHLASESHVYVYMGLVIHFLFIIVIPNLHLERGTTELFFATFLAWLSLLFVCLVRELLWRNYRVRSM